MADRFWSKVAVGTPTECWPWTGYKNRYGYGRVTIGGKLRVATHIAMELDGRARPDGAWALHTCDNPQCVNPGHLYWGTQHENMRDRNERRGHHNARLSREQVRAIRESSVSSNKIAQQLGVNGSHVRAIRRGDKWGAV